MSIGQDDYQGTLRLLLAANLTDPLLRQAVKLLVACRLGSEGPEVLFTPAELMEALGVGEGTARRVVNRLREVGVIEAWRRPGAVRLWFRTLPATEAEGVNREVRAAPWDNPGNGKVRHGIG